MKQSKTNETTRSILEQLYSFGVFAWRQQSGGIPMEGGGFRPAAKTGQPDIMAVLPSIWGGVGGRFLGIEVKTGKDRLRPSQIGFHSSVEKMGGIIFVVKDYDDFLRQWYEVFHS